MTERVPYNAPIVAYHAQADALLAAWRAGEESAIKFFWQQHPRFRRADVSWVPKLLERAEVLQDAIAADDARVAIAGRYVFLDCDALSSCGDAVADHGS